MDQTQTFTSWLALNQVWFTSKYDFFKKELFHWFPSLCVTKMYSTKMGKGKAAWLAVYFLFYLFFVIVRLIKC